MDNGYHIVFHIQTNLFGTSHYLFHLKFVPKSNKNGIHVVVMKEI